MPADGVVRAQTKCEIHNCLLTREVTGKTCNGQRKSFQKITFKNAWLPLPFDSGAPFLRKCGYDVTVRANVRVEWSGVDSVSASLR